MHHHIHSHDHSPASSPEETLALLEYMLNHNRSHAQELHELAHCVPEEAASLLHAAVEDFTCGNDKRAQAAGLLKGE